MVESPVFRTRNLIVADPDMVTYGEVTVAEAEKLPCLLLKDGVQWVMSKEDGHAFEAWQKEYKKGLQ